MALLESYLFSFKTLTSDDMLIHMYVRNVFGEKISSQYPGCQRFFSRWGKCLQKSNFNFGNEISQFI